MVRSFESSLLDLLKEVRDLFVVVDKVLHNLDTMQLEVIGEFLQLHDLHGLGDWLDQDSILDVFNLLLEVD